MCAGCGRELTADERGLTRKLVSRGTDKLYCLPCLGEMFKLSEDQLLELIEHFRAAGCTLFSQSEYRGS